jgi:hypothetical protein
VGKTLAVVDASDLGRKIIVPETILSRWGFIEKYFDPGSLAKRFAEDRQLITLSIRDGFQEGRTSLYEAIIESCPEDTKFRDWCADELRKTEKDTWLKEIQLDDSGIISLALACKEKGVQLELQQPFLDALHTHATKLFKNEVGKPKRADEWPTFIDFLRNIERVYFQDQLYELLQSNAGQAGDAFFALYGSAISSVCLHNDPSIVTKVLSPMIDTRNVPGLQWARNRFMEDPRILDKVKDEHREVFINRLREELVGEKSDEANKYLREIAKTLDVQPSMAQVVEEPPPTT